MILVFNFKKSYLSHQFCLVSTKIVQHSARRIHAQRKSTHPHLHLHVKVRTKTHLPYALIAELYRLVKEAKKSGWNGLLNGKLS